MTSLYYRVAFLLRWEGSALKHYVLVITVVISSPQNKVALLFK
jgi:hypothetical protein